MKFSFSSTFISSLEKISPKDQKRIIKKLNWFSGQKDIFVFTSPLKNNKKLATHRLRIGDYRVLIYHSSETNTIRIMDVGHRKNIYQN
ncbi:type II toxin-antitoxin system mRNA interferase toxin, RelE/StbE family [Candidatus Gracilibacteria bacterium]|nr:type II toxin-antitoxin system mRNA interferase toxin, RelE/StbE family [Candidatus Gracilibacteria bacterium]